MSGFCLDGGFAPSVGASFGMAGIRFAARRTRRLSPRGLIRVWPPASTGVCPPPVLKDFCQVAVISTSLGEPFRASGQRGRTRASLLGVRSNPARTGR